MVPASVEGPIGPGRSPARARDSPDPRARAQAVANATGRHELGAIDWESFIGRKALGWVAVVLIIFAGGFFLKYAFENRWIGPLGRVALAAVAGVGLIIGGRQSRRRGLPIAFQMLTAAGLVLLYAAVYAAFGFYHLLPRGTAPAFLLLIVAEGAVVALLADAPALGLMTILGGLLTPLLLHSETDQFVSLFLYLTALNVGAVLMLTLRHWPGIGTVALLGTHALFWSWYFEQYHPEKRAWALGFHIAVYVLYLGHGLLARRSGVARLAGRTWAAGCSMPASGSLRSTCC